MKNKETTTKEQSNIKVFLDNIGRTVLGKVVNDTESTLSVENPALVHIQPNPQTNQLQLQILPLFFREFQADKSQATVWHFRKSSITVSEDVVFSFQFIAQYEQLFGEAPTAAPEQPRSDVVKLFDE
jgi:hypothetical protein